MRKRDFRIGLILFLGMGTKLLQNPPRTSPQPEPSWAELAMEMESGRGWGWGSGGWGGRPNPPLQMVVPHLLSGESLPRTQFPGLHSGSDGGLYNQLCSVTEGYRSNSPTPLAPPRSQSDPLPAGRGAAAGWRKGGAGRRTPWSAGFPVQAASCSPNSRRTLVH